MITADNLIFEGEYSVDVKNSEVTQTFKDVCKMLNTFLSREHYYSTNQINADLIKGERLFLSTKYHHDFALINKKANKVKNLFKTPKSFEEQLLEQFNQIRHDLPQEIEIRLKLDATEIIVQIISRPYALIHLAKGTITIDAINSFQYSTIESNNLDFIKYIATTLHAKEIKAPQARSFKKRFRLSEKLENIGHSELSALLDRGHSKIENGQIEDGLSDLRTVLEKITVKLVEKIGQSPETQTKIKENLDILRKNKYLDDRMFEMVKNILASFIDNYLSQIPSHHRDKYELLNAIDAKFVFLFFEDTLEHLIEKISKRI
ncbi:MAG TPA: hypothetical protein VEC16_05320 [Alphaproteobacteria bacterium]|nr:hypothetical protein [Alphaproteobacteria bacterium]